MGGQGKERQYRDAVVIWELDAPSSVSGSSFATKACALNDLSLSQQFASSCHPSSFSRSRILRNDICVSKAHTEGVKNTDASRLSSLILCSFAFLLRSCSFTHSSQILACYKVMSAVQNQRPRQDLPS